MSEHTYTILVIDDEEITRKTLSALLEKPSYRVEMAEDGLQGLELAREVNPDVILLDVMMPRMNGYDVCKRIRSDPKIGEVPIIMITALDDRDAKLNGLVVGADDFLSKPFDSLELEIRLHTLRRVDRYRHLINQRERLQQTLEELSAKNRQLQTLSQQVLTAQENERKHMAVELHDEIGQLATGLKLILERRDDDKSRQLEEARSVTYDLIKQIREMSLNLRPAALDDFGLCAALDGLFKRFTSQTRINIIHNINPLNDLRFDKAVETAAFRVVQEALTNVARHSGSTEVTVSLDVTPGHMQISISDEGKGFNVDTKDSTTSTGLSGMSERVKMAGGRFSLHSKPGKGTLVTADFETKTNRDDKQ